MPINIDKITLIGIQVQGIEPVLGIVNGEWSWGDRFRMRHVFYFYLVL